MLARGINNSLKKAKVINCQVKRPVTHSSRERDGFYFQFESNRIYIYICVHVQRRTRARSGPCHWTGWPEIFLYGNCCFCLFSTNLLFIYLFIFRLRLVRIFILFFASNFSFENFDSHSTGEINSCFVRVCSDLIQKKNSSGQLSDGAAAMCGVCATDRVQPNAMTHIREIRRHIYSIRKLCAEPSIQESWKLFPFGRDFVVFIEFK